ncbi:hypothetical protein MSAN_01859200 [Mycena sanguinolenta]|uniref:Uncharacterized protein n=1 Tax=Mycena sanguinolenta TaxID=230812 RepID=A0A8H7CSB1_9AGAR|nr:hypothetical protein MSAN_01859200 [Mycena sanguinolenta]
MPEVFPLELEREIFEIVARSSTKLIPPLLRVARRVKVWIEPLLYPVIVFCDPLPGHVSFSFPGLLDTLSSQPPGFAAEHIRHLFLPYTVLERETRVARLLAICSGVQDLVLMNTPMPRDLGPFRLGLLAKMPLTRLCVSAKNLFAPGPVDFTHALFAHVTHLDLLDEVRGSWDTRWAGLALIPRLTHLAFEISMSGSWGWENVIYGALKHCPKLQVLALMWSPWLRDTMRQNQYEDKIGRLADSDPRFVIVLQASYTHDWEAGARGGIDAWSRAEQLVGQSAAARSAGLLSEGTQ